MKLKYRGNSYEYNPLAVEITDEEVSGKYRGAKWRHNRYQYTSVNQNAAELKYRGATYYSGNPEEIDKLKQQQKLNLVFAANNNLFPMNKALDDGLAEIRSANLCRNLQRRLEVAKQAGDKNLIQMLEDEANQLSVENCQLSFNN